MPIVGDPAWVSMYGARAIDGTRPLALVLLTALFDDEDPATVGTSQVAGSVSTLLPAPSYGVW